MKNARLQGFTLVELSIVLMVIGVIIGGIIAGQAIVNNARMQTVITDTDSYITAATNFKQTYQAIPGDFYNATNLWGTDGNGCNMGGTGNSGGGGTGTCNGSGNGMLLNTNQAGTVTNSASEVGETFLFWQHLFLAQMFTQNLSNQAGSGGPYDSVIGSNVPAGSVKGSGYSVIWWGTIAGTDTDRYGASYGNVMLFGAAHGTSSGSTDYNITRSGIITPDQAAAIDAKIDDGMPGSGKIMAYKSSTYTPNCTSSATAYNVNTTVATTPPTLCSLIFLTGF